MHDDVMLNGVFRIFVWLVARQLRIATDRKIYDQSEIAFHLPVREISISGDRYRAL